MLSDVFFIIFSSEYKGELLFLNVIISIIIGFVLPLTTKPHVDPLTIMRIVVETNNI